MKNLVFSHFATDSLTHFFDTDERLADEIEKGLDLIEGEYEIARTRSFRVEQDKVFILPIRVPGRDDDYWIVWWDRSDDEVWIEHTGKSR